MLAEREGLERSKARALAGASGGSVSRALAEASGDLADDRDAALALRLDDDARTRRTAAATALTTAQTAAYPFEVLRDLIGSADGKAFRTFAQGLTLDALLLAANAHLDQLAPEPILKVLGIAADPDDRIGLADVPPQVRWRQPTLLSNHDRNRAPLLQLDDRIEPGRL